jgi:ribosomal protein L37AE/L43A
MTTVKCPICDSYCLITMQYPIWHCPHCNWTDKK